MDMVRRGCFGVAAVVFFLGSIRLMFAIGDTANEVIRQGEVVTQEFDMLRAVGYCGVIPAMIGAGVACVAMSIPSRRPVQIIESLDLVDR